MDRRPALTTYGPALCLLAAGFVATRVGPWHTEVGDVQLYKAYAAHVRHGLLPYRDVPFEYPPLAAAFLPLPGLLGNGPYVALFAAAMAVFAAVLTFLCGRLARLVGGSERLAALGVAVTPLLLGTIARGYFDLLPTTLTAAAVLAIGSGAASFGFGLLGLAVMAKGYPVVVVPVAAAWLLARGQRRQLVGGAIVFLVAIGVIGGAALALSPRGTRTSVRYQTKRPVQIESSPASILLIGESLGLEHPQRVHNHHSTGLEDRASGATVAIFVTAGILALGALAAVAAGGGRRRGDMTRAPPGPAALVYASFGATVAFAAFGKVLSPQYLLWLAPLLALALGCRKWPLAAGVALAMIMTQIEFNAMDLVTGGDGTIAFVALRNALLIGLVVLAGVAAGEPAAYRSAEAPAGP